MNTPTLLVEGDTGRKSTVFVEADNIVICHCVCKVGGKDGDSYQVKTTFDFKGLTLEKVYELAAEQALIVWRRKSGIGDANDLSGYDNQVVDVHELTSSTRGKKKDPMKVIESAFGKLDDDERAALLAKLTG